MAIRTKPKDPEPRPAAKIIEGLQEAIAVAKGKAEPHKVHVRKPKVLFTMRIDPDVLEAWKATGPGYQARMAALLASEAP